MYFRARLGFDVLYLFEYQIFKLFVFSLLDLAHCTTLKFCLDIRTNKNPFLAKMELTY